MGWAYCGKNSDTGEEMGYCVRGICRHPGCNKEIDHGLGHLCGQMHEDGLTCNHYFCEDHLVFGIINGEMSQMCLSCYELYSEDREELVDEID